MNAGLTNLATLRGALLAGTMASETRFDPVLRVIGLGVAGLFEAFCNRRLAYKVDDTIVFTGDRPHYYVPRYPISGITSIKMRYFQTDAWTEITGQPISVNYENGLVHFGYTLGRNPLVVQATWSGGYWYETLEPDDEGYPSTKPTVTDPLAIANGGVVADLPDVLQAAFILQAQQIWDLRDKLGTNLLEKPQNSGLSGIEMSPLVKQMIQPFVRYQLS